MLIRYIAVCASEGDNRLPIAHCPLPIALGMASAQALIRNGPAAACLLVRSVARALAGEA